MKTAPEILACAVKFSISKRELECAMLLVEGMGYKQIAAKMKITTRTVVKHAENLRHKMQLPSTIAAVVKLVS